MDKKEDQKIGLALGGGGPKGLAHIGIIKKLEEIGVSIDLISGTSIGAEIGGMYALTKDIEKIEKLAQVNDWRQFFEIFGKPSLLSGGLIDTEGIEKFLEKHFGRSSFTDLKIPFHAVACDINTGRQIVLKERDLIDAIIASLSIPLVFKPAKRNGDILVDGGLVDPVPVDVVRDMGADKIIAVNLLYFPKGKKERPEEPSGKVGMAKVAENTIDILRHHLADYSAKGADVILRPDVAGTSWSQFANPEAVIEKGMKVVRKDKKKLKNLV